MALIEEERLQQAFQAAAELGIKIEMAGGIPTWEMLPVPRHQRASFRIQSSIRVPKDPDGYGCGCVHFADVDVRFPDGSFKRPDIAVFCREPEEDNKAIAMIPEAVVEVLSSGYEKKDTVISVPFYLEQGVKDVILYNPDTNIVIHHGRHGERSTTSPVLIQLECGCEVTV